VIIKIYYFFKNRGLKSTIKQIFKSALSRIGMSVTFHSKKKISNILKARKIFSGRKIKYSQSGYYYIHPMPLERELNEYYKFSYWDSIQSKKYGVETRDIRHFQTLLDVEAKFNEKKKKILNFGSGHGGISIIFNLLGHNVVNVEPSQMTKIFNKNWKSFSSINDVPDEEFDLIYGSHSMEHVHDLDLFNKRIKKLSKQETIFLWEVPNALHPNCGPNENRIDIPHTYYFTIKYFEQSYKQILFLECYNKVKADNTEPLEFKSCFDQYGDSLLFIGKEFKA